MLCPFSTVENIVKDGSLSSGPDKVSSTSKASLIFVPEVAARPLLPIK